MSTTMKIRTQDQYILFPQATTYLFQSLTSNPRVDAAGYVAAGSAVGRGFNKIVAHISDFTARRQLRGDLMAMETRMLEDIGLTRGDIDDVVDGTYGQAPAPKTPGMFAKVLKAVAGLFEAMYARDNLYRELSAMDDHMLKDIGLNRADIDAVVTGSYGVVTKAPNEPATVIDFQPKPAAPKVEAILRRAA